MKKQCPEQPFQTRNPSSYFSQKACQAVNKGEKALWDSLDRIWAKTSETAKGKIESAVKIALDEVRQSRKNRRRKLI